MEREAKKILTRNRIMEAALNLFHEKGYEATTIAEITSNAGVAKGTFFNYYESKEAIINELQHHFFKAELRELHESIPTEIAPILIELSLKFAQNITHSKKVQAAIFAGILNNEKSRQLHDQTIHDARIILTPLFHMARQNREIESELTDEQLASVAIDAYIGAVFTWSISIDEASVVEHVEIRMKQFYQSLATKSVHHSNA